MISSDSPTPHDPVSQLSAADRKSLDDFIDEYELANDEGKQIIPEEVLGDNPQLLDAFYFKYRELKRVDHLSRSFEFLSPPDQLGAYRVLEQIGSGGSGIVFRCREQDAHRDVAVKVFRPTFEPEEQKRRFRHERRAIEQMNIAGIPTVYATGVSKWEGDTCFWIAMELVEGVTIVEYCKENHLSVKQILQLFESICRTLQEAHRIVEVHRDLKPTNILVSLEGKPYILDFGVSRIRETDETVDPGTSYSFKGTYAWMAPEVINGGSADTRSDIFSLGVVLFQMLADQHPYDAENLSLEEVREQLRRQGIKSLTAQRRSVSQDLNLFVAHLLEIDPNQRYRNLDDVLHDLNQLRSGKPVQIRRVSTVESLVLWARSHQILATSWAGLVMAVISTIVLLVVAMVESRRAADLAKANATISQEYSGKLKHELITQQRLHSAATLYSLQSKVERTPQLVRSFLKDDRLFPRRNRSFAWHTLMWRSLRAEVELPPVSASVQKIVFSPDNEQIAVGSYGGHFQFIRINGQQVVHTDVDCQNTGTVLWSQNGQTVYAATKGNRITKIDVKTGAQIAVFESPTLLQQTFSITPDERTLHAFDKQQHLVCIDLKSREINLSEHGENTRVVSIWYESNGSSLNALFRSGALLKWSLKNSDKVEMTPLKSRMMPVEKIAYGDFSGAMRGGPLVAYSGTNSDIHIENVVERKRSIRFQLHGERLKQLELIPPRHLAALTSQFALYDPGTRLVPPVFIGRGIERPTAFGISADRTVVVIGNADGRLKLIPMFPPNYIRRNFTPFFEKEDVGYGYPLSIQANGRFNNIVIGHAGGWLASMDRSGDTNTAQVKHISRGRINSIDFAKSNHLFAIGIGGETPELIKVNSDPEMSLLSESKRLTTSANVTNVKFFNDDKEVLAVLRNGEIWKVDTNTWTPVDRWKLHERGIYGLDCYEKMIVTGGNLGWIKTTDAESGEVIREWKAHTGRVNSLVVSQQNKMIYSASTDGQLCLWTLSGKLLKSNPHHVGPVRCLALSPDQRTLASGGNDRRVIIWDAITGSPQMELTEFGDHVVDLIFSDDSREILTCCLDSTTYLWSSKSQDQ